MRRIHSCSLGLPWRGALLIIALVAVRHSLLADDAAADPQQPLIQLLTSEAPAADKALACKQLAIYGTGEAVPALAPLLVDPELSSWARIALEAIPDPAASDALRQEMERLRPQDQADAELGPVPSRLLIGVIHSLGIRRDAAAVERLAARLHDDVEPVAAAAALALGQIGNEPAIEALTAALAESPDVVRSAAAEGCILAAEQLLAVGQAPAATRLYDLVRAAKLPRQRILEATRGAILARQEQGLPLLIEQLESSDSDAFELALSLSRELLGSDVTAALIKTLSTTTVDRQAQLVLALADRRGDPAVTPAVLQAAQQGAKPVRTAALTVLQQVGDLSCVPGLLAVANEDDAELSQGARAALEALSGAEVDADIVRRLPEARGPLRRLLIELIGQRRIDAVPALLQAADDTDPQLRAAAIRSLGSTVNLDQLGELIQRLAAPKHAEDAAVVTQSLGTACIRMPDREACAKQLVAALGQAPVTAQCAILEILGSMGGEQALQAVGAAARNPDPQVKDTASRLLGGWMSVDASPILLDLATQAGEAKYETRALRGYIRLIRQFELPDAQRTEMCRLALQAAKRDAEKKLVLEVLERYPSVAQLKLAIAAAQNPTLQADATRVSLAIAQKLAGNADVQPLLTQLGSVAIELEIIKAEYGAGAKWVDVTALLQQQDHDLSLILLPSASYNESFGGDPVPGAVKQLKIQYRVNGKPAETILAENAVILLTPPAPN